MTTEQRVLLRCGCGGHLSAYTSASDPSSRFVLQGTQRVYERARPFRIHHIALDLELRHGERALVGEAILLVERIDPAAGELVLDAVGFDLEQVAVRRGKSKTGSFRAAAHVYDGDTLTVPLPARIDHAAVRVRYRAQPRRGMYFLAPDERVPDRPRQIWTQCQDEDARHIFPCHDKPHVKQTMDISVRTEPGWFVLSNGDRVGNKAEVRQGRFRYAMRQAIPTYLFTIVAGEFVTLEADAGGVPLTYHVPAGREADAERTFGATPAMIRLFAERTGVPYPWTKYAQIVVHDFVFGGMENTGATTMYEHILVDERAALDVPSDDLVAHELAHQWFGNLVTCRDWSHAWLNEGFATFFEQVWREHRHGRDEYLHGVRGDLQSYLSEADTRYQRPVVCQDYLAPIDLFDAHLYERSGVTLHSLRVTLGDEIFWRGVKAYLAAHAGGFVETRDLLRAMEEVSGRSLELFFEQSVARAGHPKLRVKVGHERGALLLHVRQSLPHGVAPYRLAIDLDVGVSGSRKVERHTRWLEHATDTFAIPYAARPQYVVIDPDLAIVGRVQVEAPRDMLRRQLEEAPTGRGRVLAAEGLGRRDDPASVRALGAALANGRVFWGARAVAAESLGRIGSTAAFEHLREASRARQPKVRRAVMKALGGFRTPEAAALLAKAARDDESFLVAATACRALGATRQPKAFEILVELLDRPSWADVLRSGALDGLGELRDPRGLAPIREQTAYGIPTRGRRRAVAALARLSPNPDTRDHLESLLHDDDPHLRVSVVDALLDLGDVKARSALSHQLDRELDGRVRRRLREAMRDLGGKGAEEVKRLRESLDELTRQHAELKARVSALEQQAEG